MDATLLCSQWLPIRSTQQHTHNTLLITLLLCSFFFISDTYNKPQLLGLLEAFNTHTHSDKFTIIHHHQLYQCFLYTVSCPLTLSKTGSSCNTVQDTSTTGRGVGLLDMSYSRLRTVYSNSPALNFKMFVVYRVLDQLALQTSCRLALLLSVQEGHYDSATQSPMLSTFRQPMGRQTDRLD